MNGQPVYQQYKEVQVNTANSGKLLIMLYQGCIKFLRIAGKGIEDKDIELANNNIIKAQNIIRELINTLDMENGGEIARNLYSLYDFMNSQLIYANINKELAPVETVENMMLELLEVWQQVVDKENSKKEDLKLNVIS
jgi:flagellar secretion chaperone FliS